MHACTIPGTERSSVKEPRPVSSRSSSLRGNGVPIHIHASENRDQAEVLARRIRGRLYQGKPLNAWVPTMDW